MSYGKSYGKSRTYKSLYSYTKHNLKYVDRYGDPHYKRQIKYTVVNRFGDVVKVVTK